VSPTWASNDDSIPRTQEEDLAAKPQSDGSRRNFVGRSTFTKTEWRKRWRSLPQALTTREIRVMIGGRRGVADVGTGTGNTKPETGSATTAVSTTLDWDLDSLHAGDSLNSRDSRTLEEAGTLEGVQPQLASPLVEITRKEMALQAVLDNLNDMIKRKRIIVFDQ
jgi:hypothetical protein